ncbi:MAG: anthranilate phosphoribosyltransferase [Mariprofundaceae bacterium]
MQNRAFAIADKKNRQDAGFSRCPIDGYGDIRAPAACVDLPCYAGKRRATHVHLVAAMRVAGHGTPVLIHGVDAIAGRISAWQVLQAIGVRRAKTLAEARNILAGDGIAYADVTDFCPSLHRILGFRPRLGVRSFAHTVARLLNPLGRGGQANGFFHTPYARLMAEANVMLGQACSLVFMGAEGEPELYADRQKLLLAQQGENIRPLAYPPAHAPVYPLHPVEKLEQLLPDARRMLAGEVHPREQAVFERMLEAYRFASHGKLPETWACG